MQHPHQHSRTTNSSDEQYLPYLQRGQHRAAALMAAASNNNPIITAEEALRRVSIFMQALLSAESFDQHTLSEMQVISSEPGRAVCTLQVTPQLQNRYGTLHGGAIATLVDVAGSLALVTQSARSGVSLAINTLYLNPMPGGEQVQVDARVIKLGRDVATIEVQLRRSSNGQLVATGTHTKKLVSSSDMSALFEADVQPLPQLSPHHQRQQARPAGAQSQTQSSSPAAAGRVTKQLRSRL